MKIFNSSGVFFKYHGDVVQWMWPWARNKYSAPYHSSFLTRDFNNFRDYWLLYGEDRALVKLSNGDGRLHGFDLMLEIIPQWLSRIWPNEFVICLSNVNTEVKGPKFWSMLREDQRYEFLKDIVILRCKDNSEMETLLESIDIGFASAIGVFNGEILGSNYLGGY